MCIGTEGDIRRMEQNEELAARSNATEGNASRKNAKQQYNAIECKETERIVRRLKQKKYV